MRWLITQLITRPFPSSGNTHHSELVHFSMQLKNLSYTIPAARVKPNTSHDHGRSQKSISLDQYYASQVTTKYKNGAVFRKRKHF